MFIKRPISRRSFIKLSAGTAGALALSGVLPKVLAQGEEVTVVWWHSHGGDLGELLTQFVDDFNALGNGITVRAEYQGGYEDHMRKLVTSAAANALPDMIHLGDGQYPPLARGGILQPLDAFIEGPDGIDLSTYDQPIYRGVLDDAFYQLAYGVSTPIYYYSADVIAEAGLSGPPETWDAFFDEYLPALTRDGQAAFAYEPGTWWQQSVYWSHGVMQNDDNWNVDLANPAVVRWFEKMQRARQQGQVLYPSASSEEGALGLFTSQRAAMFIGSTGSIGSVDELTQEAFTVDVGFLPAGPGGRFVPSGGNGLSIIRAAAPEVQEAAWTFITYLHDAEQFARYDEISGYVPITAATTERMQNTLQADPRRMVAIDQFEFSRWHMKVHTLARGNQAMSDAWNEIVQTDTSVQPRLERLQEEVVQIVRDEGFEPTTPS